MTEIATNGRSPSSIPIAQPKRLSQDAVKLIREIDTAIGYNQELEKKNTDRAKIWLPLRRIST
ncbi:MULTISPECIES: hypothetical protein [unclassified Microcoleus]|uniref:hypothetical protein n=1 Tax=unclassified Microcoleus TaxID=2642155 RepID=UPI0025D9B523|nr:MULTISPECIES: hypothetical protein [unclassified Microcoleus]